jgi:hypothetical protein
MNAAILRFGRHNPSGPHILPQGHRVSLEVARGRVRRRLRPVRARVFLIGSAHDCDLVIGDLRFPEAYAYVFVQDGKVSVRWLGSGPDLIVGGQMVESAELFHDDRMAFGPFELRVVVEEQSLDGRLTACHASADGPHTSVAACPATA